MQYLVEVEVDVGVRLVELTALDESATSGQIVDLLLVEHEASMPQASTTRPG